MGRKFPIPLKLNYISEEELKLQNYCFKFMDLGLDNETIRRLIKESQSKAEKCGSSIFDFLDLFLDKVQKGELK